MLSLPLLCSNYTDNAAVLYNNVPCGKNVTKNFIFSCSVKNASPVPLPKSDFMPFPCHLYQERPFCISQLLRYNFLLLHLFHFPLPYIYLSYLYLFFYHWLNYLPPREMMVSGIDGPTYPAHLLFSYFSIGTYFIGMFPFCVPAFP